jgi:hypothetical protein
MPTKINLQDLRSRESLLALYNSIQNDISFYRAWEWNITVYYALLSTGIISLITNDKISSILNYWHRWGLTVVQSCAIIFSVYHLHRAHYYLMWNRKLRNRIEQILGFFEKEIYIDKESILPAEFNNRYNYYKIGFKEFVFPFILFLVIYELVTIYIIWKV